MSTPTNGRGHLARFCLVNTHIEANSHEIAYFLAQALHYAVLKAAAARPKDKIFRKSALTKQALIRLLIGAFEPYFRERGGSAGTKKG